MTEEEKCHTLVVQIPRLNLKTLDIESELS
jgi:hypothetical protein